MKQEKLLIKQHIGLYMDTTMFEGTLKQVSDMVLGIPARIKETYVHLDLSNFHDYEIEFDKDYDGCTEIRIKAIRWETDDEFNKRIEETKRRSLVAKKAATQRAFREQENKRLLYEKLKKEFENG